VEVAGSSNDVAASFAARGCPEGTVVVAGSQSGGRGRQGRPWHSPPGANLYCSVVLRPARPVREWADLSWVVAAAVASAARGAGAGGVALKYPNDVMAGGRKLAGVLLETRTGGAAPAALVAGIGFNANLAASDLPGALRESATSLLMLTGRRHDLGALLGRLCGEIDEWYATWVEGGAAAGRARLVAAGLALAGADALERGSLEDRGDDPGGEGG